MSVRPAHAALLIACVACNGPPVAVEPPAQPAEIVTATLPAALPAVDGPPPDVNERLEPALAIRYREALTAGGKHVAERNFSDAIDAYSAALAAVPADPRALAGRGHANLLAGHLDAATADLHAAADHASESRLAAEIHLDLGLLAEQRNDPERALTEFSLANLFAPSSTAAEKIAGRTTCLADIAIADSTTRPAPAGKKPTSWLELWTTHFEPSKANLKDPSKPADDNAARHRVCHYEALALDACAGQPPWLLRIPGGHADESAYADQYVLVDLTSTGTLAAVHLVDLEMDTPCDDLYDVAIAGREPIVVRTTHTPSALGDDDCVHNRSSTITTVHARDTLEVLLTVTAPNRPGSEEPITSVQVSASSAKLTGGGCDRTINLPTPPR